MKGLRHDDGFFASNRPYLDMFRPIYDVPAGDSVLTSIHQAQLNEILDPLDIDCMTPSGQWGEIIDH